MMTTKIGVQASADYLNGAFQTGWIPGEQEDLSSPTLKKAVTVEYVAPNQFKIVGLVWTDRIQKYTRFRLKQGETFKYFECTTTSANADTLITVDGHGTYVVENAAITDFWFSNSGNPIGWPWGDEIGALEERVETLETDIGVVKEYYGSTLPERHLWVDGKTIGDASSGATARANADVFNLFAVLWGSVDNDNSQIKLYDSVGVLSEKGASAAEDFAAHKKISLPDRRDNFARGVPASGRGVGNYQEDAMQGHKHNIPYSSTNPGGVTVINLSRPDGVSNSASSEPITDGINGNPRIADETRPKNVACHFIMRY